MAVLERLTPPQRDMDSSKALARITRLRMAPWQGNQLLHWCS
jgi:hypothetical protein